MRPWPEALMLDVQGWEDELSEWLEPFLNALVLQLSL